VQIPYEVFHASLDIVLQNLKQFGSGSRYWFYLFVKIQQSAIVLLSDANAVYTYTSRSAFKMLVKSRSAHKASRWTNIRTLIPNSQNVISVAAH